MVAVGQIGRYRVGGRLPNYSKYVSGLGVWDDELVVSLSLVPVSPSADRESVGILLKTPRSTTRWALEVVAPVGIVRVSSISQPTPSPSSIRPPWLLNGTTSTESTIIWISVDEMVAAVEGV